MPACPAGYVPAKWHQVKVVFIPKCGRNSYSGPSDFRPISLKSFLLKTMARLVDGYLQDEVLALVTLHPNQHGYQAGKSVKMVLHQLLVQVEKAFDQKETALGVFLDIEGAFNNTLMTPCVLLLSDMELITPLYCGLEPPWRAAWLRRLLLALPCRLQYPGDAHVRCVVDASMVPCC